MSITAQGNIASHGRILSFDELTILAQEISLQSPDLSAFELLHKLSAAFLAAYFPAHAADIEAGNHDKIAQLFSWDLLSANGLPCSQWFSEKRQEEICGGIQPLLFEKLSDGLLEFYGKKLAGLGAQPIDPLTCEGQDFG